MEPESMYPGSFRLALSNKIHSKDVPLHLQGLYLPIFVYGSLMLPSVINSVLRLNDETAIAKRMIPAKLRKHKRYSVKFADYPAIIPTGNVDDSVDGMLVFGLDKEERDRLDKFESGLYRLRKVGVELILSDGEAGTVEAETYVWGGDDERLEDPEVRP
jgi:gamma-glutamylcyclotransferase (GGCT)/AIG2-like uncharacterized protein YtfP